MINQEAVELFFKQLDLSWDDRLKRFDRNELRVRWCMAWEEAVSKKEVFPHMPTPTNIYMIMPPMTLLWFTALEFESAIDATNHRAFAVPEPREGGPKYWIR